MAAHPEELMCILNFRGLIVAKKKNSFDEEGSVKMKLELLRFHVLKNRSSLAQLEGQAYKQRGARHDCHNGFFVCINAKTRKKK